MGQNCVVYAQMFATRQTYYVLTQSRILRDKILKNRRFGNHETKWCGLCPDVRDKTWFRILVDKICFLRFLEYKCFIKGILIKMGGMGVM
jgi:hypothetical protein